MNNSRLISLVALTGTIGAVVLASTTALTRRGDDYRFLDPLIDIKQILNERYVDLPNDETLQAGAINGMLEALNDPYTVYVPPAKKTEFTKDLTGEYVGIGAQVNVVDGWLTIVTPLEDSPAYKVGLMADDKVVEIDGKTTHKLTVEDCVKLLSGTPGTQVNLTIERKGEKIPVVITREHIKTKSVKGFHREDSDANKWMVMIDPARRIGYVRLTQFTPQCADELQAALEAAGAREGKLAGLVLDLRNNPGGLLSEAIKIADLFLKDGVIVSTKGRTVPEEVTKAKAEGTLPDFPMVVLLNGQSASASEVLSGALVENNRAVVVGTRSFGKGLVQNVLSLQAGGELKITEQKYYLPSGRCIQRTDDSPEWGVEPTAGFYVPVTDDELLEMYKARRQVEVMRPAGVGDSAEQHWSDPEWILSQLKDKQLAAAVKALQLRTESGAWTPTGQAAEVSKVSGGELLRLRQTHDRLTRELIRVERREDALEGAGAAKLDNPEDLWPDTVDVTGGKLQVFDKDGKLITTLKITGNTLEKWLIDAEVKKEGPAEPAAKQ